MSDTLKTKRFWSNDEIKLRQEFFEHFKNCPIPEDELLSNLGLFINRQNLSRILFFHELYKKIINVHGSIIEFGVRWGQNLALFESFRGIYEPYNFNRKIIGFDTFSGFNSIHQKDGSNEVIRKGAFSVTKDYKQYLEKVLEYHEKESPLSHIKKYHIVEGDATVTVKKYLEEYPETIIALAYFDFDIYEPTKRALELIKPHLTKGSVIGFDQVNFHEFQGETLALKEIFPIANYKIKRSVLHPYACYLTFE